jgi:hypothetical protein
MTTYTRNYESVAELVEKATAARDRDPYEGWCHREYFVGRDFGSWEDVVAAANGTWDEGVREVESMLEELRGVELSRPVSRKRRAVWADEGDELNYDRFRSGQECWRAMRRQTCQAPQHITILAQVGATGDVSASQLMWRGAAAIALADLLEQAGYRVTVYMANLAMIGGYKDDYSYRVVKVKDASEPVNVANLVNVASPWFYRSVFLQEHSTEPKFGRLGNSKRGSTRSLTQEQVDVVDESAILIQHVRDRDGAVAKVREVIAALGQ